jgi:RHS repeat-associated protein
MLSLRGATPRPPNLAAANFSSKEFDKNNGLIYYLYRFYDPNLQKWPNRDPISERGGMNLYGFVFNDSIDGADLFGLGLAPGSGGALASMVCNCKQHGGKWSSLAQEFYAGDIDKCADALMAGVFPGNIGGTGTDLGVGVGLGVLGPIIWKPLGPVGQGLTLGVGGQRIMAIAQCSQMYCLGAKNGSPPPKGPVSTPPAGQPQIPCGTCVVNSPTGPMAGSN